MFRLLQAWVACNQDMLVLVILWYVQMKIILMLFQSDLTDLNVAKKASAYFLGQNHSKTANVIWWIFGDGLACCPIERILVWRELYLGPDIFKVLAARYSTLKYSTLRNILQTQRHENCKLPSFNIVPSIIYGRSAT